MNPIDADRFFAFLTEQKVKETGAFSKGLNKGLNIARSALKNKEITLPWEVDRVKHGQWLPDKRASGNPLSPLEEYVFDILTCSECGCGFDVSEALNYCPNCGARMDGDKE